MAKVAVITRTRDRAKLLERAIQSVHSQTYEDFIHVVINDAGDKSSVEASLNKYADIIKDRVKLIHNKESAGIEAASNKAIHSVDSKYIVIHDDDDTWHPEFLERTIEKLETSGAKGVVVRTDKIIEDLQQDGSVKYKKTQQWMPHVKAINLYRQCTENQMTPISFIYAREAFDAIGDYDEQLAVCGDWDFGIRFIQKYDVEYLDPGFALANYHHRRFKEGALGNTSFAGNDKARYYTNYLMNKYLRLELAEGRLGVGYIMSKQRYNENKIAQMLGRILPGGVVRKLKRQVGN